MAEPHRHGGLHAVAPAERGGSVPVSPAEERRVISNGAVVEGILVPRGVHRHHRRCDRKVERRLRRCDVYAGILLIQLLLYVRRGVLHRKPLVKRRLVGIVKDNEVAVKHPTGLDLRRDPYDVIVAVLGGAGKKHAKIRLRHRFGRADAEIRREGSADPHGLSARVRDAGAIL